MEFQEIKLKKAEFIAAHAGRKYEEVASALAGVA